MHATPNLSSFLEGVRYDLKWRCFTADLSFWTRQVRKYDGPVLDLAGGTGRVALHLARAGHRVTAIEGAESLMREAARKSSRMRLSVEWLNHDIRGFDLGSQFPLVIFPLNGIGSLTRPHDLEACFSCVKRHLTPRGKFIIDSVNPCLEILVRDPDRRFPHARYSAPDGHGMVRVMESNNYDRGRQINYMRLYHRFPRNGGSFVEESTVRVFFPQELNFLLKYNGFLIEAKYGDYNECAFDSESPRQLVVCSVPDGDDSDPVTKSHATKR
jgi:SAM-dependent methyltransferase